MVVAQKLAAMRLVEIHAPVGGRDERGDRRPIFRQGADADADAELQQAVRGLEPQVGDGLLEVGGARFARGAVASREHHDELVAAAARAEVGIAHLRAHRARPGPAARRRRSACP